MPKAVQQTDRNRQKCRRYRCYRLSARSFWDDLFKIHVPGLNQRTYHRDVLQSHEQYVWKFFTHTYMTTCVVLSKLGYDRSIMKRLYVDATWHDVQNAYRFMREWINEEGRLRDERLAPLAIEMAPIKFAVDRYFKRGNLLWESKYRTLLYRGIHNLIFGKIDNSEAIKMRSMIRFMLNDLEKTFPLM